MTKQATNSVDMGAIVRGFVSYAESTETIERAQSVRFESRKIVADFVRANHDKEWKKIQKPIKAAIDGIAVGIVKDKVGLLGVVKTCIEYGIMPTTLNADRLRKAKTWVSVEGKNVANTYGKVHKVAGAGQTAKPTEIANAPTVPALAQTQTATAPQADTPKAPSVKPATPQTAQPKAEIPRANVSSSEEPIPAREHCGILLDQLFKNESFRSEFAPILAACLDSNVATVTRCLVEARDAFCKGNK